VVATVRLRVDWNVPIFRVPEPIRQSVERRLAMLWRFLDCSPALPRESGRRSEEFAIHEERWRFTYLIDLDRRAAVVNQVVPLTVE
jgi:hypothetical protein